MTGEGPLAWMDEVEMRHWMALAAARAALAALSTGADVLAKFPSTRTFQVGGCNTEWTGGRLVEWRGHNNLVWVNRELVWQGGGRLATVKGLTGEGG